MRGFQYVTLIGGQLLAVVHSVTRPVAAFRLIMLALVIVSFHTSISGIVKAKMFPPEVRALGVGLAYAAANALFGGSAEYVALGRGRRATCITTTERRPPKKKPAHGGLKGSMQ